MSGIIKRRKTSDYAQIHNGALQELEDIRSIGLISHLMSLPESWTISKMQLYKKFGRGPISKGIAELEEKRYWVDIQYREGKKNLHYYNVSDVPFTEAEVLEMIQEVNEGGFKIIQLSASFAHLVSIVENQQFKTEETPSDDSSIVDFEQFKMNCSNSIVENRHLLNKELKTNIKKQNNNKQTLLINKELSPDDFKIELINACSEFYSEFAPSRWSKQAWITLVSAFVNETVEEGRYVNISADKIRGYAYQSLKNMAHKFDVREGRLAEKVIPARPVPFYNWIEN